MSFFQRIALPGDKANHVVWGAIVALAALALGASPLLASIIATGAGIAVELVQLWINKRSGAPVHGIEGADAAFTSAGGVIASLAAFVHSQGGVWRI